MTLTSSVYHLKYGVHKEKSHNNSACMSRTLALYKHPACTHGTLITITGKKHCKTSTAAPSNHPAPTPVAC